MTVQTKRRVVKRLIKTAMHLLVILATLFFLRSFGFLSANVLMLAIQWKYFLAGIVCVAVCIAVRNWAFPVKRELRKELIPYEPKHAKR